MDQRVEQKGSQELRTILITGATSGIGKAVAIALAKQGHRVIGTGWRGEKRTELMRDCPEISGVLPLNVAMKDDFTKLGEYLESHGIEVIDTLFVNAGIHIEHPWDYPGTPYSEWPHDKIACKTLEVNYFGAQRTVRALMPYVQRSTDGCIFFTNGTLGSFGWHHHPNELFRASLTIEHPAYSASKAALNVEMFHLARQHPELFVASLNPGWVETTVGGTGSEGLKPQPVARAVPGLLKYLVGDGDRALTGKHIDTRTHKEMPW